VTPRCSLCERRITWWQWSRGKTASLGPVGHGRRTAAQIKHLACMRRPRTESCSVVGEETVPNNQETT
jgi:hypothetical protein